MISIAVPIAIGTKYQVRCLKSRKTCPAKPSTNSAIAMTDKARDGTYLSPSVLAMYSIHPIPKTLNQPIDDIIRFFHVVMVLCQYVFTIGMGCLHLYVVMPMVQSQAQDSQISSLATKELTYLDRLYKHPFLVLRRWLCRISSYLQYTRRNCSLVSVPAVKHCSARSEMCNPERPFAQPRQVCTATFFCCIHSWLESYCRSDICHPESAVKIVR